MWSDSRLGIDSPPGEGRTIIIGAGLAGLVCAVSLASSGRRVLILEAEDSVGGRVRTAVTGDGFRIDRGFQVLFSAYPALRRHVPLAALQPKYFASGCELMIDGHSSVLGHPLFDPTSIVGSIRSGLLLAPDLWALGLHAASGLRLGDRPLVAGHRSTRSDLEQSGVTEKFVDRVISPLFGGISLDRSLSSDSTFWHFVLRNMVLGRIFLPEYGVGQLTQCLAARLPSGSVRLNTTVTSLRVGANRVTGVMAGDDTWTADQVVVATDAVIAQHLTGESMPVGRRSCTTTYFASQAPVTKSKRLILNSRGSLVNHVVQLTNISRRYAPPGNHLLSATSLDIVVGNDTAVAEAMLGDLQTWLPGIDRVDPRPVAVVRVPYAQFDQEPGVYGRLPKATTSTPGLYLAGEFLHSSSVQGAMRGGELAATAILDSIAGRRA